MSKRIVVTGMGCVSPLGLDLESTWQAMLAGKSGVAPIQGFDSTDHDVKIAAEIPTFDPTRIMTAKEARRIDRFIQLGMFAARAAFEHAGLVVTPENAERIGAISGSGIGGIGSLGQGFKTLFDKGPDRVTPFLVVQMLIDLLPGQISMDLGLKGPNFSVVSACATSGNGVGEAAEVIKRGDADVMIAGGADAGVVPIGIAAFHAMRALSTRNDEPTKASRPFDADRDGFVMAEAGGMMVLESLEHAQARGATIHAELLGYGLSADAHHVSAPSEDGEGAARAMRMALKKAGLTPKDIGYINAHATSTPLGDRSETNAIKSVFGPAAYDVAVSSTKSMTGHLLGAAGVIEAMVCVKAIHDGILPPTINLERPDPVCDLDYVPNVARKRQIDYALSNSFGFGGHNSSLILTAFRGQPPVASAAWLDEVRRMLAYVNASDATEVEVAGDGFRLRLLRRPGRAPLREEPRVSSTAAELTVEGTPLVAPLTGVFYRAGSPGAPPLVSVGDAVEAGAVVGLIETMKIFNEVLAERGGRIATILVESGQLVHAGDALMTIEDAAGAGGEQAEP